jgi:hypothetical protein
LAEFALMQMTPFAFVELNVAGGGFKQPAVLDMAYDERLHDCIIRKLRSERIPRIFFKMYSALPDEMAVEFHYQPLCGPMPDNLIALD